MGWAREANDWKWIDQKDYGIRSGDSRKQAIRDSDSVSEPRRWTKHLVLDPTHLVNV